MPVNPGVSVTSVSIRFVLVGRPSSMSRVILVCRRTLVVSTNGAAPLTVMLSSSDPTGRSALTVAVKPAVSVMPSRLRVLKPVMLNVTEYEPGRRSTKL